MKWLKWLKEYFGRKDDVQTSVVPQSDRDTGELIVPKQLGAGNPSASEQRLIEMSQDLSNRETVIEAKESEARIEVMRAEQKHRERELDAKIANDKARLEFEQKQLELNAEEMRRVQDREDDEARARVQREQFIAEQEQFRLNNEQAAAQAKENQEKKAAAQAKAQRTRRRSRRVFVMRTKRFFGSAFAGLGGGIKFLVRKTGEGLGKKWVKSILAALTLIGASVWFFLTESGQQLLFGFLGWVEQNQLYVITGLITGLVVLLVYKYWDWVKPAGLALIQRKAFWAGATIIALISGIVWLYRQNFFEGWLAASLELLWSYGMYAGIVIAVVLPLGIWRWVKKSQTRIDRFNAFQEQVQDFCSNLLRGASAVTRSLILIGLSLVAIYGSYFGISTLILGSLGIMPVFAFGLKPGPSLWFRFFIAGSMGILAVLLLLPSRY